MWEIQFSIYHDALYLTEVSVRGFVTHFSRSFFFCFRISSYINKEFVEFDLLVTLLESCNFYMQKKMFIIITKMQNDSFVYDIIDLHQCTTLLLLIS